MFRAGTSRNSGGLANVPIENVLRALVHSLVRMPLAGGKRTLESGGDGLLPRGLHRVGIGRAAAVLFPSQVIRADDLGRAMLDVVLRQTQEREAVVFENRTKEIPPIQPAPTSRSHF